MSQPKTLVDLVRQGTFRARRDHELLASADLPWDTFATIQRRYRAAADASVQRSVGLEFERLVREAHTEAERLEHAPDLPVAAFTLEHFSLWAEQLILDNGKAWTLEPFQRSFIADVFAGFRECWAVWPEGNTKTTTLAGLALYHIQHTDHAWAPWAASSRDQAQIGYQQAAGFVERSKLKGFRCLEGYRRITFGQSRMQIFAADERTGDGVIPTFALLDELHRHRDLGLYRTWRGKIDKRHGQICAISTAGEPGSEFEAARETIRQSSQVARTGSFSRFSSGTNIVLHEWAVPDGADPEDLDVVKAANPFSGITVEMLRDKLSSPTMTTPHWRRFVCNLPTRNTASAITESEWIEATAEGLIPEGEPVWVGLDLGWNYDTTAIVPLWWRDDDFRQFGPATILEPPRTRAMLSPNAVKAAFYELHERNPIDTVVMDPTNGADIASWLEDELPVRVLERSQTAGNKVIEYARFMEALRTDKLKHSGDEGLTKHVMNAVAEMTPRGDHRFERPEKGRRSLDQPRRVIDALDAAAMVHAVAVADLLETEPQEILVAFA